MFCMNTTSSVPKSVLSYDVDEDLTSVWFSVITQSCSPNKETDSRRRVKLFILFLRRGDYIYKKNCISPQQNYHLPYTKDVQESQQLSVSKSGIEEMQKLRNHNKQINKQTDRKEE